MAEAKVRSSDSTEVKSNEVKNTTDISHNEAVPSEPAPDESTERNGESIKLSRNLDELEIDLDLTRSVTEELDKRLQLMHRAKTRGEDNHNGNKSNNNNNGHTNNNTAIIQRSHDNKEFGYLDSCKDVLTAEDLSLTRHLLIEDAKGDSIDSGAPSSRESSSSPDSMSLKGKSFQENSIFVNFPNMLCWLGSQLYR